LSAVAVEKLMRGIQRDGEQTAFLSLEGLLLVFAVQMSVAIEIRKNLFILESDPRN